MVSNNLLNYTIQDTVMNTSIKHPRMVNPGTEQTFIRQDTDLGGLEVHTTDGIIEIDTTDARASMGLGQWTNEQMVRHYSERGKQHREEFTRQTVSDGRQLVTKRATKLQLIKQHFIQSKLPDDMVTDFFPGEDADLNARPGTTDITHHPTEVNIDWANTDIVPYYLEKGTVSFDIVQRAYVHFQYMGRPNFFPDPNFQSWA